MSLTPNPPAIPPASAPTTAPTGPASAPPTAPAPAPASIPPPATATFFKSCCEEILPIRASNISGVIITANDITGAARLAITSAVTFFPK